MICACYSHFFVHGLRVVQAVLYNRARTPSPSTNIKKLKKNNNVLKRCATFARYVRLFARALHVARAAFYNRARTPSSSTNIKI
jgi:hypothetical protein